MRHPYISSPSRRYFLRQAGAGVAGLGLAPLAMTPLQSTRYFPPSEPDGGWRIGEPGELGVDPIRLREAIDFHDGSAVTQVNGGALVVVHQGHLVAESYVTGREGGPQPWTERTCNAVASSTKSVFGTAVGVFLEEFRDRVDLDSYLVGESRDDALVPQIWDQPITDERKKKIRVKHVISMTSGHDGEEPWRATNPRRHYPGYEGAFQLYEYCFGWWEFEGIPSQHRLHFEPGQDFHYSNFGMEQLALAMRNLTGEMVGPYVYDRVLRHIGMPVEIRNNQYRHVPEPNFSLEPGWAVAGSEGCDAYGTDKSESSYGYNTIVGASLRCTARDLARLGYLWLNRGRWGDRQLVAETWMQLATRRFVRDNGESPVNYGYTFWILDDWEGVPKDAFSSRGYKINDCFVVPSVDLVVARLGNVNPSREERTRFTKTLLQKVVAAIG